MGLYPSENYDDAELIIKAQELIEHIIQKYDIYHFDDFKCPYTKALAKELFYEDFDEEY